MTKYGWRLFISIGGPLDPLILPTPMCFVPVNLRLSPLIPMPSVGISHALYLNGRVWIDLPRSFDGPSLRAFAITDSVGTWPPNRIISFFFPTFDKQFAAHKTLLPFTSCTRSCSHNSCTYSNSHCAS